MRKKPKIVSLEDVKRYLEMAPEEKMQRTLIAVAAAQFSSIECIYRQRLEMKVISPEDYRKIVNEAERTRDEKIARHTQRLEEIQGRDSG